MELQISTDVVIDESDSGIECLSISPKTVSNLGEQHYSGTQACLTCGGTGRAICTFCSGTGGITQYSQTRNPVTRQYTIQSNRAFCSRCGSSGWITCHAYGGAGRR